MDKFVLLTVVVSAVALPHLAYADGEPACPVREQPLESAELEMPTPRSTGELHNPQEADIVVEFVVDVSGAVSEVRVVTSNTWPVRRNGATMPHYFDQAAVEHVGSRRYEARTQRCRGEATIRFRFEE